MATLTSTTFPKTETSWPSPDTSIDSAAKPLRQSDAFLPDEMTDESELPARVREAYRRIDEIQIEKKANGDLYCKQMEPLLAQFEAEKDEAMQKILYREKNRIMDAYFECNDRLDEEATVMHRICREYDAKERLKRIEEEANLKRDSAQTRCLACWRRCEQLEELLNQKAISKLDALQNEAETLLEKAREAKTVQDLEALLPAINDMICSLQASRQI